MIIDIDVVAMLADHLRSEGFEISEHTLKDPHLMVCVRTDRIFDAHIGTKYFGVDARPIIPIGDVVYVGARIDTRQLAIDNLSGIIVIWDEIRLADPASLQALSYVCQGKDEVFGD